MNREEITLKSLKAKFSGKAISPARYYAKDIDGNKVKEIRLQMGMTQDNFALYFGISRKTLESWEQSNKKLKGTSRLLFSIIDDFADVKESLFKTEKHFITRMGNADKCIDVLDRSHSSNILHDVERLK